MRGLISFQFSWTTSRDKIYNRMSFAGKEKKQIKKRVFVTKEKEIAWKFMNREGKKIWNLWF